METRISPQTLRRLPAYMTVLKEKRLTGIANISAGAIADELGLVEIQVRKDLASVSDKGKPRIGYIVDDLLSDLEQALGCANTNDAVLIGAGKLGKALLSYDGFREYGLNIVAAFDADERAWGVDESGVEILPPGELRAVCERLRVGIGIITVPASAAQSVCDALVACGVIAVWNFAPAYIRAPDGILVKNENMAVSLAELSNHLAEKYLKETDKQ